MKKTMLMLSMLAFTGYSHAAAKPCEELKSEIAAKIESKGVTNYTLEIVPVDEEKEGREVGTCDGGTMKIIYIRG